VPELVAGEQQLADPTEDPAQGVGRGFLYTFADTRHAHLALSLAKRVWLCAPVLLCGIQGIAVSQRVFPDG
jgi:hypothetical protein